MVFLLVLNSDLSENGGTNRADAGVALVLVIMSKLGMLCLCFPVSRVSDSTLPSRESAALNKY